TAPRATGPSSPSSTVTPRASGPRPETRRPGYPRAGTPGHHARPGSSVNARPEALDDTDSGPVRPPRGDPPIGGQERCPRTKHQAPGSGHSTRQKTARVSSLLDRLISLILANLSTGTRFGGSLETRFSWLRGAAE